MSWDFSLRDAKTGEILMLDEPHYLRGGTYAMNGTNECWFNITYNYGPFYYRFFPENGIREINGKTGLEAIGMLTKIIAGLKDEDILESPDEIRKCYPDIAEKCLTDKEVTEEYARRLDAQECGGYWRPTERNARRAVQNLLTMSTWFPDGVWRVD